MSFSLVNLALGLALAPLLLGVINRTKAVFAGRRGQPFLQLYYDLRKLMAKGAVYSRSTSWVFRLGPWTGVAVVFCVLFLLPCGRVPALISFEGDFLVLAYFLGLMRFFTVIAALDTASSFEGMGASREVEFSALAEPALLLALAALGHRAGNLSLSNMLGTLSPSTWVQSGVILGLVVASLLVVLLAENARIPVDDPNTHLELTMIHEAMVLDHSGPDFAAIQYSAALKFWILGAIVVGVAVPWGRDSVWLNEAVFLTGMLVLSVLVGIIESSMARLRLLHVPRLLMGAGTLSVIALVLVLR